MNTNNKIRNIAKKFQEAVQQVLDSAWQSLQTNVEKIPQGKTFESALACLWMMAMFEGNLCLSDLLTYDDDYLRNHQRVFYFQVRFCMETFSTLNDMKTNPSQVEKFYDGIDKYNTAIDEFNKKNYKESSKLLRQIGKMDGVYTDRIATMFDDLSPAYALLCWHCHPHFMGQMFEASEDCIDEMLSNVTSALAKILPKSLELLNDNSIIAVPHAKILSLIQAAQAVVAVNFEHQNK